jgi:hypothetical protein
MISGFDCIATSIASCIETVSLSVAWAIADGAAPANMIAANAARVCLCMVPHLSYLLT